jgi:hypothetical protein
MNYPRLTKLKTGGHALYVTAGADAEELNNALDSEMECTGKNKSESARGLIINGSRERKAQDRVALTLDLLDALNFNTMPPETEQVATIARMALLGCAVTERVTFTGELSAEYKKRYGE